jgi:hypothetical protein
VADDDDDDPKAFRRWRRQAEYPCTGRRGS